MFGLKEQHIEAIGQCFSNYQCIDEVIIYGSRAKGNYKPGSDIDLTIVGNSITGQELLRLENELDDLLLPYKIDISLKDKITNPDLIDHINRVGRVFYTKPKALVVNEPAVKYEEKSTVQPRKE